MLKCFWSAALVGAVLAACSGADPAALSFTVPWDSGPTGIAPTGVEAGPAPTPADGGVPAVDSSVPAPSPFEGSYASGLPATTAKAAHQAKGVGILDSNNNAAECLGCHAPGQPAASKAFVFAGYVSTDKTGGTGKGDVEILLVDSAGNRAKTHSDANGHYWFPADGKTYKTPIYVGLRTSTVALPMKATLDTVGSLDCNKCHNSTTSIGGFLNPTGT